MVLVVLLEIKSYILNWLHRSTIIFFFQVDICMLSVNNSIININPVYGMGNFVKPWNYNRIDYTHLKLFLIYICVRILTIIMRFPLY